MVKRKFKNGLVIRFFPIFFAHPYPDDLKLDRFITNISYSSGNELENILKKLDFSVELNNPELAPFKEYNVNHSAGWVLINNCLCYLNVNKILKIITIDVSGSKNDLLKMSDATFKRALKIEEILRKGDFNFIDPPEDDPKYCNVPKFYPKIWEKED
jgi:hypothetical protein